MDWYLTVMSKFADYKGRARRREYWMFILFNFLIALGIGIGAAIFGNKEAGLVYQLLVLVPGTTAGIRRLHDTNHSGWWMLVPIIGLVFLCLEGEKAANRFGPDPRVPTPEPVPQVQEKAS